MRALLVIAAALTSTLAIASCERGPRGGVLETRLVAATAAVDASKVGELLASGADPNKMVEVDGRLQSAWFLALAQLRPHRAEHVAIVLAMRRAGASPSVAWGTDRTGPKESFWEKLSGPSRRAGSGAHNPLQIAMRHPVPEVVRALIGRGFDPRDGQYALVDAVEAGEDEIVHMLVDAGVDVNTTAGAITPLVAAIHTRNVALMTYLEDHGAREKP